MLVGPRLAPGPEREPPERQLDQRRRALAHFVATPDCYSFERRALAARRPGSLRGCRERTPDEERENAQAEGNNPQDGES